MTSRLTMWSDLPFTGDVLLVINSDVSDSDAVFGVFDEVQRATPSSSVYVIASPTWQRPLEERGRLNDRVLFSVDADGAELELNYFLETVPALRWITGRTFETVLGSSPHNLYNEEIKDVFERHVYAFLRDARFLAHTLPAPYLFVFGCTDLLRRFGRKQKVARYVDDVQALIADLHHQWEREGRPPVSDDPSFESERRVLANRLGAAVLDYDEASAIPIAEADVVPAIADVLHGILTARDAAVDATMAECDRPLRDRVRRYLHRRTR